jgi:hypothetical protein
LSDANDCYHEVQRSQADLIAQGYDAAQVKALPNWGAVGAEALARDTIEAGGRGELAAETINTATRPLKAIEHYIRMDYDGSGKARLYLVTTGGEEMEVLRRQGQPDLVAVDAMPFAAMTSVIVTHRFFGRSLADLVIELQKIKTGLIRALLDNAYLATLDDLLVARPGGLVRTKSDNRLTPVPNQPIGDF